MKKSLSAVVLLCTLFVLFACSDPAADSERITALEAEVRALRLKSEAWEKTVKKELALVRKNLESIQTLLENGTSRESDPGDNELSAPSAEQELDEKAKSFVNENLARLMELTRKLLDNMEQELDERLNETKQTPPQGDEI
ncbi:hypothetical protein [uncultured Pseudodesulfovibrio sp.]|uniref:hypothetical protein n=1 Tax=uncultured Pseudodesulfovibrio sp. TaxID=2035858 RepID=UPI0029C6E4DF|nr:hypothetical protein [uncultured Pseudodesulfovibrio sp.]